MRDIDQIMDCVVSEDINYAEAATFEYLSARDDADDVVDWEDAIDVYKQEINSLRAELKQAKTENERLKAQLGVRKAGGVVLSLKIC